MQDHLIGYLLNALDERTSQQVKSYLEQNPAAQEKLTLLKHAIAPLDADAESPLPPPQLSVRTLARIAEHICSVPVTTSASAPSPTSELPHAPVISPSTLPLVRSWWRRADVLVAACLLFLVAGIGATILGRMRLPQSSALIADCQNNLRQFFTALHQYRDTHGKFPDISKEYPRDVAGMVVPLLREAKTLPAGATIRCPGNGAPMSYPLTLTELRAMSDEEFARHSPSLSRCYAYSLGYRDGQGGKYYAPGTEPRDGSSQRPIMADSPPLEGIVKNSANHGGVGQNVLFSDGHVIFVQQRTLGDGDDIFQNWELKVAAGLDLADIVLGYSAARP